jgi:hypothetical protein
VVSFTPRPLYLPPLEEESLIPIEYLYETGWSPEPVYTTRRN